MKKTVVRMVTVESLEARQLFAWGATAIAVHQDDAAATYPTITGKGVTIAMVDTGVDYTHSGLGGGFGPGFKVKGGWDFVDNDADPMDTYGHGTNVAGILAGEPFDFGGAHYSGIAPDAEIVALRIAKDGGGIADSTMEKALQWIETNYKTYGISIVNVSFGSGRYTSPLFNGLLSDEFQKIRDLGMLVVASSGNEGTNFTGNGVAYPAADKNVYAAGALNTSGQISSFSERGSQLDVLAPGEEVPTTTKGNGYAAAKGTSFATPFVTGGAALLKQVDPSLRGDDLMSILRASGDLLSESTTFLGNTTVDNYSKLDLKQAISLAGARVGRTDASLGKNAVVSDVAYDKDGVLHLAFYDARAKTLKYATRSTGGQWSAVQTIEKPGRDVGAYLSLAIDATGKPSIAYFDATNADLRYAHFDGEKWTSQKADSSKSVGQFPSLAFNQDGKAFISYYRKTSGDLRVLTFDGTTWTRTAVDGAGDVGRSTSVAVGSLGAIGIAYSNVTKGDLNYATFDGSSWTTSVVDNLTGVSDISIAFNGNTPSISYFDVKNADLKFATLGSGWEKEVVARKGVQGQYSTLFFDPLNQAHIIYYNATSDRLMHLYGSTGAWTAVSLASKAGRFTSATITADGSTGGFGYWSSRSKKLLFSEVELT